MTHFYPTLVTDDAVRTINFYEDYFGLVPTYEKDGYALLQSPDNPTTRFAVFDSAHECVAHLGQSVQGLILTLGVDDIEATYDSLYMEGLDLYKELGTDIHGARHFVVYDPNRVLVNVVENKQDDLKLAA